jgi:hypothetical protein
MQDINGNLDTNLKYLDTEEKSIIKKGLVKSAKPNKNRQEIQYYFLKVLQDDARLRKLCCKYQKAMYEGTKAISDFDDLEASEIGELHNPDQFIDEDYGDLGLSLNKDNIGKSPMNGSVKNVNINDIDLEEMNNQPMMGLLKKNLRNTFEK